MKPCLTHSQYPSSEGRTATLVAYSIFFFTGSAMMLPGALLPLLAKQWHMADGAAGVFFLCFSVGSSGGSLLAKGKLSHSIAAGCALIALGAVLLGTNVVAGTLLLVIAVYGCGLGLAMTSISLLQSRRWPQHRIAELARLNLTWALGAGVGPAILLRTAVRFGTTAVLHGVGTVFVFSAIVALLAVPAIRQTDASGGQVHPVTRWLHSLRAIPLVLLCLIPLATGVESGVSSWLSSFMMRGGYVLGVTISATTAFGVGLIVSRLFHSRRKAAASQLLILHLHPALMVAGIVLLIVSHSAALSVVAAFLTGVGVGPMYPLVLALLLNHNEAGNAGFVAGGVGASILPMITGAISGWTHSLRTGLSVLLAASVVILVLGVRLSRSGQGDPAVLEVSG
jgi:FHS family glucose/mannose:H+ symporter-like MFS transporter